MHGAKQRANSANLASHRCQSSLLINIINVGDQFDLASAAGVRTLLALARCVGELLIANVR